MSDVAGNATEAARQQAVRAREELAATLDAIEGKLNVPKRASEAFRANPVPFRIGAAAAAAVVIGLIAWAVARD